jgi:hypothetical protein
MKLKLMIIFLILVGILVYLEARKPDLESDSDIRELTVKALHSQSYFRDRFGVCYSVLFSKTYFGYPVASHTVVDCAAINAQKTKLLDIDSLKNERTIQ